MVLVGAALGVLLASAPAAQAQDGSDEAWWEKAKVHLAFPMTEKLSPDTVYGPTWQTSGQATGPYKGAFLSYTTLMATTVNMELWEARPDGAAFAAHAYGDSALDPGLPDRTIALIRARTEEPIGASCGVASPAQTPDGLPYILIPETWGETVEDVDRTLLFPESSLKLASILGQTQAAGVCNRHFPSLEVGGTPYARAMDGLGLVEGLKAAVGVKRFGSEEAWSLDAMLGRLNFVAEDFAAGRTGRDEFLLVRIAQLGAGNLTEPLFASDSAAESYLPFMVALLGADLSEAYETKPSRPLDPASVWAWYDDALMGPDGPAQLGRILSSFRYLAATKALIPAEVSRADWQYGMNGTGDEGCAEVELSLMSPVETFDVSLNPTASACFTVAWKGEGLDPSLPPGFAVLAEARGGDAADLDGLQLAADQNFERLIEGTESVDALPSSSEKINRIGLVVEDARTGDVVKNWEVVFKSDTAFDDGRMTLLFTNARTEGIGDTRPLELAVTFGEGVHKAEADLDVTTFAKKDAYCERPRKVVPPLPSGPMVLMETGRTVLGNEGTGFDQAPTFSGIFRVGGVQGLDTCARAMTALGFGALGEDMGMVFGGLPAGGLPEDSPVKVCQARLASVQAGAMQAMKSGRLTGAAPEFELSFEISPEQRLTGPGTYPARFSLVYTQPDLDARGYYEPTYADGRGTVTVISQSNTHMHLRYDVQLDDPGDPCEARISGRISGDVYTPYALASAEEAFAWATHPRDVLGEKTWNAMPEAAKREMLAEWQSERTPQLRSPASYTSPQRAESGLVAGCTFTEADLDAIIEKQLEGVPDDLYQTFYDIYAEIKNPEYPPELICIMKDDVLGKN
ncbi:hypothetical protein HY29_16990 [Hyphomonas beringensis]|uniref:Uncharacterized protein n=2 Tax=Hyphomonas beringensis TaxID=1280946 RepID=A0A062UBP0_9PROT|nr:hypothetical protein HY29_16990 [Hyphomonas beringensis]